jgi:hypothetical protein
MYYYFYVIDYKKTEKKGDVKMKKYVTLFTSLGLLYSIGLAAHQVNAEETHTSTSVSDIAPRDIRVITHGEMTATGAINGLRLQGNNTVTTGEIQFTYKGTTWGAGNDDNTDFVFSVPDELAPLVNNNEKDFRQYIAGKIDVGGLAWPVHYSYVQNDITIEDEGHSIRFRNPQISYLIENSIDVTLTIDLGQAVTDTGIRIPDAKNNTTYDFNGGIIGKGELIDWGIIGDSNAPFSLPTYQLDPGWDLIQQIPTIEPVTDKDTSVKGRGYPGADIEVKIGDTVLNTGKVDSNGIYEIPIDPQAAGVTLSVTQNTGVGWSEAATTIVTHKGEEIPAPAVDDNVTTESDRVTGKGTTPGNTITVKNHTTGAVLNTALVQPDGSFTVLIPKQQAYTLLDVIESNGEETSPATTVVVKEGTPPVQENKITHLDTYSISTSGGWIKGTYEGSEVARMQVIVGGTPGISVPVKDGVLQYYAGNLITSTTQTVQVQILDASGTPLDTQPLTITA